MLFENNHVPFPFVYYAGESSFYQEGLNNIPAKELTDVADFPQADKIYVVEYLADITDHRRLLEQKLQSLEYKMTDTYNFLGVGFIKLYRPDVK